MKYFFLLVFLLHIPFCARGEGPRTGTDEPDGAEEDTTGVYNLLDTLSFEIGDKEAGERLMIEKSLKDNLLDIIYGAIFRDTTDQNNFQYQDLTESEERFRAYENNIIAHIYLKKIPVFGGSVDDSLSIAISDIEEFGNSLHTNTRDRVIFNNLFFHEGDPVRPFVLADNERILRQLPFIRDARILVIPGKEEGQVYVLVLTRDLFSIGTNLKVYSKDDIAVSLFDRNLFGNGWEFRNTLRNRSQRDPSLGYEGVFDVRNIAGSFISGTLTYRQAYDGREGRLTFAKDYLTPETKYAGGLDLIYSSLNDEGYNFKQELYRAGTYDFWLGRSFPLGDMESRNVFKLDARFYKKMYDVRPFVRPDTNFIYHNQNLYLGNIIFNSLSYYTGHMVVGFGRTEDISQGYALEFTGGFSDEEFRERVYGGAQFWFASWSDHFGYIALSAQSASYLYRKKAEDGLIKFLLTYFTPLLRLNDYRFRHFLYGQYVKGLNRQNDQLLDIDDTNGIRGLIDEERRGTEKLVLTLENRTFTPWSLFGFRFTLLAFADLGFISNGHSVLYDGNLTSAFGAGCLIRNEGLVLQTINFRFAYYPEVADGKSHFGFKLTLSEPLLFSQLRLGKPRIFMFE